MELAVQAPVGVAVQDIRLDERARRLVELSDEHDLLRERVRVCRKPSLLE